MAEKNPEKFVGEPEIVEIACIKCLNRNPAFGKKCMLYPAGIPDAIFYGPTPKCFEPKE